MRNLDILMRLLCYGKCFLEHTASQENQNIEDMDAEQMDAEQVLIRYTGMGKEEILEKLRQTQGISDDLLKEAEKCCDAPLDLVSTLPTDRTQN